jgi:hypothetical protein
MTIKSVKNGTRSISMLVGNAAYRPLAVVTGGTLTSDATYYYRTFTSSST